MKLTLLLDDHLKHVKLNLVGLNLVGFGIAFLLVMVDQNASDCTLLAVTNPRW